MRHVPCHAHLAHRDHGIALCDHVIHRIVDVLVRLDNHRRVYEARKNRVAADPLRRILDRNSAGAVIHASFR